MKRKLFILLAAFMALATFQTNAQTSVPAPYNGGTIFYLNVWSADMEKVHPNCFRDNFFIDSSVSLEHAKDYPISGDPAVNPNAKELQAMKYVFNRNFVRWELTNNNRVGTVGDVDSYFTLTANTGSLTNTYQIKSASPRSMNDKIFFKGNNGEEYNEFVFLRFLDDNGFEYNGNNASSGPVPPATVRDSVGMVPWDARYATPEEGGYLAAHIFTGRKQHGINDRALYVVAYDTTLNVNGAPNDRYAIYSMDEVRNNWNALHRGVANIKRIVPVWVKADRIGGRWARTEDFPDEFVKFPIQPNSTGTPNYFTVGGVSIFSVNLAGALNFGEFGSLSTQIVTPAVGHPNGSTVPGLDMSGGDNPAPSATNAETKRLRNNGGPAASQWELQYFTIANPCDGKLVRVIREQIPNSPLMTGEGQFGNKLAITDTLFSAVPTGYTGATLTEMQRTQQFAIWINEAGNMELYPLNSWTYRTSAGSYKTTNPTSPNFNYSVWMDRPYTTTQNHQVENFNNSFKIGQMSGQYVTGPVSGAHVGYSDLELRPEKALLINQIDKHRWYFIQVGQTRTSTYRHKTATGDYVANDSIYVLDMVRSQIASTEKRVVITAIERNRYTGTTGRYFDTPYDSVNMSAHWRFEAVPGGYNIINQLGDTLEYDYSGAAYTSNDWQAAYIKDKNPSAVDRYKSDVWQTVHLDCWNGFFKLRNMAEVVEGFEKPVIQRPYLDTLAVGTGDPSTSGWWYEGLRGRHASTTSVTNPANHYQKDVRLVPRSTNAGLLMKLTEVGYEYAPGGDNNNWTNHSDDAYSPADDSLCVYLYKEGNYNLTEAVSLALHVKEGYNGPDAVWGRNLAAMTANNTDKWIFTEPVISNENPELPQYKYMVPMTYVDASSNVQLNVDYMLNKAQMNQIKANHTHNADINEMLKTEGFNVDTYKWHYIKNQRGEYLIYDTINTTTGLIDQYYGFKFKLVDRNNATMFRFYQPLVGDKAAENFILEFRVGKHHYNINRQGATPTVSLVHPYQNGYSNDNWGVNPFIATTNAAWAPNLTPNNPGAMTVGDYDALKAAVATEIAAHGTNMGLWATATVKNYLAYLNYERAARTKYAVIVTGSDMLLSTWNDGRNKATDAPQAATRFKFTGDDETMCPRDYVDSKWLIDNQLYANPTVKASMMDVHVNPSVPNGDFIGTKANRYADNNPTALNLLITLADTLKVGSTPGVNGYLGRFSAAGAANNAYRVYENTREVEMYYIQNSADTTLYLTVDSTSLYAETMESTLDGVSGVKLIWSKKYHGRSQVGSTVGEASDYRPLQMFAIYGCKSAETEYGFGNFILIPAASWEYNYTAKKHTGILANTKIGNGTVTDEFRISEGSTKGSNGVNYMIVMPSSLTAPQGVTPSEYTLTRDPLADDDYFCEDTNGGKHSFIQAQGFLPSVKATGNFIHSYKANGAAKDYYDPSQHWSICKVAGYSNLYTFTPESDLWDGDGEKVPARNQLVGNYYLVQTPFGTTTNEFGQETRVYTAIAQYAPTRELMRTITITRISETKGDACITAFKRFEQEDLLLDWGILESIYTDRYIYSNGKIDGTGYTGDPKAASAFYAQATSNPKTIQYLRLRESNYVTDAEHHGIPFYNIIHVVVDPTTKLETEYYLEMKENTVQFRTLTADEKRVVVNFDDYPADTMQAVKFCFPYTKNHNGDDSTTVVLNSGTDYTDINVGVRTMPYHNQIYWLAVDPNNTSRTKAAKDPGQADVFILAPKANMDEEWIGDANKEGWLKDFSRSSVYLVEQSGASPVNYGLLSYVSDVLPDINDGKFQFEMVYDTIINKYAKTKIWYYHIKAGSKYLTYMPLAGAPADYKYGDYTYAYFADKLDSKGAHGADEAYKQTFGLLINKRAASSPGHSFPFWVIAQVPSGNYKYLGQYNNRMVFIPTVGNDKADAQSKAMTFELGKVASGKFTGKEGIEGNAVAVVGLTGAVKVSNAEGTIELFTIDGRKVGSAVATGSEQTITAPRGVVIVKVGGEATKVLVK